MTILYLLLAILFDFLGLFALALSAPFLVRLSLSGILFLLSLYFLDRVLESIDFLLVYVIWIFVGFLIAALTAIFNRELNVFELTGIVLIGVGGVAFAFGSKL
jgi:multidrug transporter EmrE-like cation transporter